MRQSIYYRLHRKYRRSVWSWITVVGFCQFLKTMLLNYKILTEMTYQTMNDIWLVFQYRVLKTIRQESLESECMRHFFLHLNMLSADKIKMNILFLIGCRSELSCSNVDQISVFLLYLCVLTLLVKFRLVSWFLWNKSNGIRLIRAMLVPSESMHC